MLVVGWSTMLVVHFSIVTAISRLVEEVLLYAESSALKASVILLSTREKVSMAVLLVFSPCMCQKMNVYSSQKPLEPTSHN